MTNAYKWVQWNRHKKLYDLLLAAAAGLTVGTAVLVPVLTLPPEQQPSPEILLMRGLGIAAALMLHVILSIGPLARLDDRFAPLLYNRRHLGVAFFAVTLLHFLIATGYYGGFGGGLWITNLLAGGYREPLGLPFELFGFVALLVFFAMAASSHDFWLATLGSGLWKSIHMLAYPAYGLVVLHVLTGPSLSRQSLMPTALLGLGAAWLTAVHLWAAVSTRRRERHPEPQDGWVDVGPAGEIPMDRARVVHLPGGASAAVFRHAGGLSAVTNRCTHQGGPLGEGQIVDGCITCPWHGYQFRPHDGCSPPPYTEKIATHELRLSAGRVQLRVLPNAPGTPVQPIAAEVGS